MELSGASSTRGLACLRRGAAAGRVGGAGGGAWRGSSPSPPGGFGAGGRLLTSPERLHVIPEDGVRTRDALKHALAFDSRPNAASCIMARVPAHRPVRGSIG